MSHDCHALDVPPAATTDSKSFELLRVWAAHGQQHVVISSKLNGGPEGFGFMIAQLIRHGAFLYHERDNISFDEALERVRDGFDKEWADPTGNPSGGIGD